MTKRLKDEVPKEENPGYWEDDKTWVETIPGTGIVPELRATLAARDAEIERLKDKAIRFDLDQIGIESRERDAVELVEARAEIERLKAELSLAQFDAATDRAAAVSLGELVEKRERQLVWTVEHRVKLGSVMGQPWFEWTEFYGQCGVTYDGTRAGLLAAIDEATAKETE